MHLTESLPRLTLYTTACYQIKVQTLLSGRCATMFNELTLDLNGKQGTSTLTGTLADQAALHGLLIKIRDLGLPLISVVRVEPDLKQSNENS